MLRLPGVAASTGEAIRWVEGECAAHAIDREVALRLAIVVEEVVLNVAFHNASPVAHVELTLRRDGDQLELVIEDDGAGFDPTGRDIPSLADDVDVREVGGLGIHLVMSLMDVVDYHRALGRNCLVMRKSL